MDTEVIDPRYFPIRVTTFGELKIEAGPLAMDGRLDHSKKMSGLLAFLLLNADRALPYDEILRTIWPENDRDDPVNALKTLIYRVRNLLKDGGFPYYQNCILAQKGAYRWNPAYPFVLDCADFEAACNAGLDPECPPDRKVELLRRAVSLYKGEFLPKCAVENWVVPLSSKYYALFLRASNLLVNLLRERQEDEEVVAICRKALTFEPLDEHLNYILLVALIDLSRTEEARSHYNYASRLFFHKLGSPPSSRIRDLYQRMMESEKHTEADLDMIQHQLREPGGAAGAYVCEYPMFKEIYRLQSRMAARAGITIYLGLVTLTETENRPLGLKALNSTMEKLEEIMRDCLRKTDVVSRFSTSQYVLMLPATSADNCVAGIRRVISIFKRRHPRSRAVIRYTIQPLEAEKL